MSDNYNLQSTHSQTNNVSVGVLITVLGLCWEQLKIVSYYNHIAYYYSKKNISGVKPSLESAAVIAVIKF